MPLVKLLRPAHRASQSSYSQIPYFWLLCSEQEKGSAASSWPGPYMAACNGTTF
jgi:hypothetical protein